MSPVTPKEENVFPTVDEINGLTQDETTEETIANLLYEIKK
jgi:hypothetical protein